MFTTVFFWIGFSVVVGVASDTRGRNGAGWCMLALVLTPLLAGALLLALPRRTNIEPFAPVPAGPKPSTDYEAYLARTGQQ